MQIESPLPNSFRNATLSVVVFAAAACVVLSFMLGYGIIDDAYISLRYADNLVQGHGLVFNPAERVEGYTNPLWTLLLAAGLLFTSAGAVLAICLSLAAACFAIILAFRLHAAHFLDQEKEMCAVSTPLAIALSAPFLCYGASGLETPFFTLLLLASAYLFLSGWRSPRHLLASAIVLATATLTRPEASICFLFNLGFLGVLFLRKNLSIRWRDIIGYAAIYGSIVGAFLLWRHYYYGFWRPNTYYAKVGEFSFPLLVRGSIYVGEFLLSSFLFLVLPCVFLLRPLRSNPKILYAAGLVTALLTAVTFEGGDHLALFRFCVPVIPFAAILVREALYQGFRRLRIFQPDYNRRLLLVSVGAATVALTATSSLWMAGMVRLHGMSEHRRARYEVHLADDWAEFGRYLRENSERSDAIALLPVGAIGYYSKLRVIDMVGLTDLHVAHLPSDTGLGYIGHEKYDNQYVLAQHPRFIMAHHIAVFESRQDEAAYNATAYFAAHRELTKMPELREHYVYRTEQSPSGRWFAFYEKK